MDSTFLCYDYTRYLQNNDTLYEYSGYEPSAHKSLKEPLSLVDEKLISISAIDSSKLSLQRDI